jgi:hypothetical protein
MSVDTLHKGDTEDNNNNNNNNKCMVPSRAIDFSLPKSPVQTELWPTKPPIQWVNKDIVLAVKRP